MFNVEEFRNYITETGTSPKNRYMVSIGTPAFLYKSQIAVNNTNAPMTEIDKDINLRAENITIPGVSLITSQVSRYGIGPIQQFATNAQMSNITMEFLVDREKTIWMFFYHWINNIFSFNQIEPDGMLDKTRNDYSYRTSYMSDYATTIAAYMFDYVGEQHTTVVEIYDAFPVSIEQIDLGWANNNSTMKIRVRFSYRDWRIVNTSTNDAATRAPEPPAISIPGRQDLATGILNTATDWLNKLFG